MSWVQELSIPLGVALIIMASGVSMWLADCRIRDTNPMTVCAQTCGDRGVQRASEEECVCR